MAAMIFQHNRSPSLEQTPLLTIQNEKNNVSSEEFSIEWSPQNLLYIKKYVESS